MFFDVVRIRDMVYALNFIAYRVKTMKTNSTTTQRPIMELLNLIGQRWTLRIMWELKSEPSTFRALQEKTGGIAPSVLNSRLKGLRDAKIIELTQDGYALTDLGQEFGEKLLDLSSWAEKWKKQISK